MRALVAVVLVVVGVLIVIAGVLYMTETAHALPSFFPGHVAHATSAKRTKHGIVGLVVGGVVAVVGLVVALTGRRNRW